MQLSARHSYFLIKRCFYMSKFAAAVICCLAAFLNFGCGGSAGPGNNQPLANSNQNSAQNTNLANVPPEFSTSPVPLENNTAPGIPANAGQVPKGATPIPGIPANTRPLPKGTTPTPGIPSEEELRRQQKYGVGNINAPPPANGNPPMILSNRKWHVNRPQ